MNYLVKAITAYWHAFNQRENHRTRCPHLSTLATNNTQFHCKAESTSIFNPPVKNNNDNNYNNDDEDDDSYTNLNRLTSRLLTPHASPTQTTTYCTQEYPTSTHTSLSRSLSPTHSRSLTHSLAHNHRQAWQAVVRRGRTNRLHPFPANPSSSPSSPLHKNIPIMKPHLSYPSQKSPHTHHHRGEEEKHSLNPTPQSTAGASWANG